MMSELDVEYLKNPPYGGNRYFGSQYSREQMIAAGYEIERLRAAAGGEQGGDGWRPIETAPKDGTEIDVWCPELEGGYRVADAYWSRADHKWLWNGQGNYLTWAHQPTHWRPVPHPPGGERGGEAGEVLVSYTNASIT